LVLQFLCPRKSCRDLTKLPDNSCLMPLEMSQGTCDVHTRLANVTQDPWETCMLWGSRWLPGRTLGISGGTRPVFLRKLIIYFLSKFVLILKLLIFYYFFFVSYQYWFRPLQEELWRASEAAEADIIQLLSSSPHSSHGLMLISKC